MRLPEQAAPVLRPPYFPMVTVNVQGVITEVAFSDTDPNDPGPFSGSSDIGQAGCHILSEPARCLAGRSRY